MYRNVFCTWYFSFFSIYIPNVCLVIPAQHFLFHFFFSHWVVVSVGYPSANLITLLSFMPMLRKSIFANNVFFFLSLLLFLSSHFPNLAFSEGKQFALMLTLGFSQADQNNWQVIYNKNALHTRMRDSERQNSNWTDLTDCNFDEFMIDSSEASELFINHTVIQATKCMNRTFIHLIHIYNRC